jgi:hypothetical protein
MQLPQMSASSVTLVTQAQTCTKAAQAMDAAQGTSVANRVMYVFKLGNTRFAVRDANGPGTWYFTNKWVFLSRGTF